MDCGKTFSVTINTIVSGTRKELDIWTKYVHCMMNGWSIRKSAKYCGIHPNTASYWRYKILSTLEQMQAGVTLSDIIEVDETFFPILYTGNHTNGGFRIPRASRYRGKSVHTRGISKEQVCVVCAIDCEGHSIARIADLGRLKNVEPWRYT